MSFSQIPLSIPSHNFFFFGHFSWSKIQRFSSKTYGKTFFPFLFHQITWFHASFMHFLRDFRIFRNLGFLMFLGILIKIESWVFLHASFKHDSHNLISKLSWFIKTFEIRVLKFLRDLGVLLNWVKLNKIYLCFW